MKSPHFAWTTALALLALSLSLNAQPSSDFPIRPFTHLMELKGFTPQLMSNHLKLYEGYVKNCNALQAQLRDTQLNPQAKSELQRHLGWEFNGMRLHELFFENLGNQPLEHEKLRAEIIDQFGSLDSWKSDFVKVASTRGIGWVILYREPSHGGLIHAWIDEHDRGLLSGAAALLVMDVWEHAYLTDYQIDRPSYIQAFIGQVNWAVVAKRWEAACR